MSDAGAIGSTFAIGISQIGTPKAFDFMRTVISQYANSDIILHLLEDFDDCVDPTQNLDSFFDLVWNVDTAQGYGLDVWGRIVGVSRILQVNSNTFLGFAEAAPDNVDTFGNAIFFGASSLTSNFTLSDSAYRVLILAKALANISDGSIKSINQLLINLFPGLGNCYVRDDNDMTMVYVFGAPLSLVQQAIVNNSGVLPKPTGVSYTVSTP